MAPNVYTLKEPSKVVIGGNWYALAGGALSSGAVLANGDLDTESCHVDKSQLDASALRAVAVAERALAAPAAVQRAIGVINDALLANGPRGDRAAMDADDIECLLDDQRRGEATRLLQACAARAGLAVTTLEAVQVALFGEVEAQDDAKTIVQLLCTRLTDASETWDVVVTDASAPARSITIMCADQAAAERVLAGIRDNALSVGVGETIKRAH